MHYIAFKIFCQDVTQETLRIETYPHGQLVGCVPVIVMILTETRKLCMICNNTYVLYLDTFCKFLFTIALCISLDLVVDVSWRSLIPCYGVNV